MSLERLFEHISADELEPAKALLASGAVGVNQANEHGMTALQHASYKGRHRIAQMLIDQGADVCWDGHEHGYTALHFAALSGSEPTVRLLLAAGAQPERTNSVRRTAAQMAAFVGNHRAVALINNFVPRATVDYYTVPRGQEKTPPLPPALAAPVHHLLMQVNLHPVHIAWVIRQSPGLLTSAAAVASVLERICERETRQPAAGNETLAMKAHYLSCVLTSLHKTHQEQLKKGGGDDAAAAARTFDQLIRAWLRYNTNMVEEYQEQYLRQCIRSFPCREAPLLQQLVANLVRSRPPAEETSALELLMAAVNGQRAFQDQKQCTACGEEGETRRCAACRTVQYCGAGCQRAHWFTHKKFCAALAVKAAEREAKEKEMAAKQAADKESGEAATGKTEERARSCGAEPPADVAAESAPVGGAAQNGQPAAA